MITKPPKSEQEVPIWRRWITDVLNGNARAPKLSVGTAANYTGFDENGQMKAYGDATAFKDLLAPSENIKVNGVGIVANATEGVINFQTTAVFNANPALADYGYFNFQINHDWKAGSVIKPHIHFWQTNAAMPNWLMEYRWQVNGSAKNATWTKLACNTAVFTYTSGTLNQIARTASGITPASYNISDIFQLRIYRDTTNASTVFTGTDVTHGDALVSSIDVHLEIDMLGSATEYSK